MTPRMLWALRMRRFANMQREEMLVGIIAATSANFSWCRPEKPLTPQSFMLHPFKPEPLPPVTGDDVRAAFAFALKRTIQ